MIIQITSNDNDIYGLDDQGVLYRYIKAEIYHNNKTKETEKRRGRWAKVIESPQSKAKDEE